MALTITAASTGMTTANLSASNGSIVWWPVIYPSTGLISSVEVASARNISSTSTCNTTPLTWGATTGAKCSAISVSAFSDTSWFTICAMHATDGAATFDFIPYYLDLIEDRVQSGGGQTNIINTTAFYHRVSTDEIQKVSSVYNVTWTITPTAQISARCLDQTTIYNFSAGYISLNAVHASSIQLSSVSPSGYYSIQASICGDPYWRNPDFADLRYVPTFNFTIDPPIVYNVLDQTTSLIAISAVQEDKGISPSTLINWTVSPSSTIRAVTGYGVSGDYIPDGAWTGAASDLSYIVLSALDYAQIYTYRLSSTSNEISGTFRPYLDLASDSQLSAVATKLTDDGAIRRFDTKVYGVSSNGVVHNLPNDLTLFWVNNNDTPTVHAYTQSDSEYLFAPYYDIVANIDELTLTFTTENVNELPATIPYSISIYATPTPDIADTIADTTIFFNIRQWLDTSIYYPSFRFQYEPEDLLNIYRPLSTGSYTISNTSILYEDTRGYLQFTFNTGTCSLSFDTTLNQVPTGFIIPMGTATPLTCSISLTIFSSADGDTDYYERSTTEFNQDKNIIFASFPKASSMQMWPEYKWNGTAFVAATNTDPASAFGVCHTEYFAICSGAIGTTYKWLIQDNTLLTTSNVVTAPIHSNVLTTTVPVTVGVYTATLPSTMPIKFYDTPQGELYPNYASGGPIMMYGLDYIGLVPVLSSEPRDISVPASLTLSGYYGINSIIATTPFSARNEGFFWGVSSAYWNDKYYNSISPTATSFVEVLPVNTDDLGAVFLAVPKFRTTPISITPIMNIRLSVLSPHPSGNDWCLSNSVSGISSVLFNCYPTNPGAYITDTHITTSTQAVFENITPFYSGVSCFSWYDRNNVIVETTNTSYVTSFSGEGDYTIGLTTTYTDTDDVVETTSKNEFIRIVKVQGDYLERDNSIVRVISATQLALPYTLQQCEIAPNEWLTNDTFNFSISRLYDNLLYLESMSKVYDAPPTAYCGWLGSAYFGDQQHNVPVFRWFPNISNIDYLSDQPNKAVDDKLSNVQDICVRNNKIVVSNGTIVYLLSTNFNASEVANRTYKRIGDDFSCVRAVEISNDNKIYMLDSYDSNNASITSKDRIVVFSYNYVDSTWRVLYDWGGYGGATDKSRFRNPSDIFLDSTHLWVVDTDNLCLKQYTQTGTWVNTITSSQFKNTAKPLSMVIDTDGYIQVLLSNSLMVKLDTSGKFISSYSTGLTNARNIQLCQDGGFIYICCTDRVVKVQNSGINAGEFATNEFGLYNENYRAVYHDASRNFYVAANNHILKYVEKLVQITNKQDTFSSGWSLSALHVNKEEYIQDWVVNKSFHRFWDNLELYRRSLLGKFTYEVQTDSTAVTILSTSVMPDGFDICNYDYFGDTGVYVTTTLYNTSLQPVVRTFSSTEYISLEHTKDQIYVGVNELVTADVLNRCIKQLYQCQEVLLQLIADG